MFASALVLLLVLCTCTGQFQFFNIFSTLWGGSDDPRERLLDDTVSFETEYDFVVVGSGSGGSVVANRLTEIAEWKVLVLEAGRDEIFVTDIPLTASMLELTSYNWGYKAQKQDKACLALKDGVCNWPSGRAVGGTSVINYMLYTRGSKLDFDEWHSLGNYGWSYQDVLPYFLKSERASKLHNIDKDYHGTKGYLNVEHSPYRSPLVDAFLNSAQEFNYSSVDINGRDTPLGFSQVQANLRNGRRCSASKAYLRPIRNRPNLHIAKQALVTKILIEPASKRAYGVQFQKDNRMYKVGVKKEVILSAGAMNSAQLLMLSGVGPQKHLSKLNIDVIQDLQVGYNLQDHVSVPGLAFLVNDSITLTPNRLLNLYAVYDNVVNRKGPYTVPGGAEAYAFISTKNMKNYADIELVLGAASISSDSTGVIRNLLGLTNEFYDNFYHGVKGQEAFSIIPVLLRPKSKGRILLRSKSPYDAPLIYPNYFQNQEDLEVLIEGVKMAVAVGESHSFQKYGSRLHDRSYPGCEHLPFRTDSYWRCCIKRFTSALYHPVGTCKMGSDRDSTAVVDPELKVKGIRGLRVVDGSVMPNIVAGHPNAVIFMIGEKAADMIKSTWQNSVDYF